MRASFELQVPRDAMATLTIIAPVAELAQIEQWLSGDDRRFIDAPYPMRAMRDAVKEAIAQAQKAFVGIAPGEAA